MLHFTYSDSRCCYCLVIKSHLTLCDPMDCSRPGFLVLHYLLKFAQTHAHWIGDAIQPSHLLSPPSPPALILSKYHGLFQWVDPLHQVAKILELQLPINIQGWFLKLDWFDLLAVQGILKSLLQYHNLKASIFWHSAFFMVQLSYPYMTTAITIALTLQTFVSKAKSLLLIHCLDLSNFLRSKCPLISLLQSPSTVILEPKKKKICQFPLFLHLFAIKWWDWMPWSYFFECWVLSQLFHFPVSLSARGSLVPIHFLPLKWYYLHIWGCCHFSWQFWLQLMIHTAWHFAWCTLDIS